MQPGSMMVVCGEQDCTPRTACLGGQARLGSATAVSGHCPRLAGGARPVPNPGSRLGLPSQEAALPPARDRARSHNHDASRARPSLDRDKHHHSQA